MSCRERLDSGMAREDRPPKNVKFPVSKPVERVRDKGAKGTRKPDKPRGY